MERRKRLGEIKPMSRADKIVSKWGMVARGSLGKSDQSRNFRGQCSSKAYGTWGPFNHLSKIQNHGDPQ